MQPRKVADRDCVRCGVAYDGGPGNDPHFCAPENMVRQERSLVVAHLLDSARVWEPIDLSGTIVQAIRGLARQIEMGEHVSRARGEEEEGVKLSSLEPIDLNFRPVSLGRAAELERRDRAVEVEKWPDRRRPVLSDGRHRVAIAMGSGRKSLKVIVREYDREGDVVASYGTRLVLDAWPAGSK